MTEDGQSLRMILYFQHNYILYYLWNYGTSHHGWLHLAGTAETSYSTVRPAMESLSLKVHTDSFRFETSNDYISPGQPHAAGVFFNAEVPEMLPTPLLSEDTSAGDGGDCQDRANAQNLL